MPSCAPRAFPRSQANSYPPRAPRRVKIRAWYVSNIRDIFREPPRCGSQSVFFGAPLRARASALPFWSSMPAQKGRARLLPNRHVDSRVPASLAPPAPSSRHFPPHPFITNSLLRSCGRYTRQRTWKMRQDAAEISSKRPPFTPDPRPAFQRTSLILDRTFVSIAHTRATHANHRHTTPYTPNFHRGQSSAVS